MSKTRPMTAEKKAEYDELVKDAEQLQFRMDELMNSPIIFGYVRVSSKGQARDGNSLEQQTRLVSEAGASEDVIYKDIYTGTTTARPELEKLLSIVRPGDTIVITKLDRISRSVQQGIALLDDLAKKGVKVNVLNMGMLDNSPNGKLLRNMLLSFAEFERDMIMQRTREGKEIAKQKEGYREGRRPVYSEAQLRHAIELLKDHSYTQVVNLTGISKTTLIKANKRFKDCDRSMITENT